MGFFFGIGPFGWAFFWHRTFGWTFFWHWTFGWTFGWTFFEQIIQILLFFKILSYKEVLSHKSLVARTELIFPLSSFVQVKNDFYGEAKSENKGSKSCGVVSVKIHNVKLVDCSESLGFLVLVFVLGFLLFVCFV